MYLVILDLNGTLLESTHHRKTGYKFDLRARCKYVYYRTGMWSFLRFLGKCPSVKIAVWTSCSADNAKAIVDEVFRGIPLEFCYSRNECIELSDYKTIKELKKVWENFPEWNASNTIIVDDSADKLKGYDENIIQVTEFIVENRGIDCDLVQVQKEIEKRVV